MIKHHWSLFHTHPGWRFSKCKIPIRRTSHQKQLLFPWQLPEAETHLLRFTRPFHEKACFISLRETTMELFDPWLMVDLCPQCDVSVRHVGEQERHISYRESAPPAGRQLLRVSESSEKRPTQHVCVQRPVIRYAWH